MISILMTGRLVSNSMSTLVLPIASSDEVQQITFVSDVPGPSLPKVTYRCPPKWLQKIIGRFLAKSILLIILGLKTRPDLVHAFNVFPHGINAFLTARLCKAKSCISVIGGKEAIKDGGYQGDNWILRFGGFKKPWLENLFLAMLRKTDIVTVMGKNNKKFLEDRKVPFVKVLPLFIDSERFAPREDIERSVDLISASSLIPRKRIDIFLNAIAQTNNKNIKGLILGGGSLEDSLKEQAKKLGIAERITFLGFSENFEYELQRSKVFFMGSNTEGLSVAMLMAMACGSVPLVRDVGDLIQAAHHNENAIVLDSEDSEDFARAIDKLFADENNWCQLSQSATAYVEAHYTLQTSKSEWSQIFKAIFNS